MNRIYCVIAEPGKHAYARHIEWEGDAYAGFCAVKAACKTEWVSLLPYPENEKFVCLVDDDALGLHGEARTFVPSRFNFAGAFAVLAADRNPDTGYKDLTREQALEVIARLNQGMPPLPLTDGNRRT